MTKYFLYADQDTLTLLNNEQRKIILIGSDSGYANFGDVLQLKGSINFHKKVSQLEPIPIFSLAAIGEPGYIEKAKKNFGLRGLIFLSDYPVDTSPLNMVLINQINSVSALHLYGGGMLNGMWGEYILEMVEYFLTQVPHLPYVVSGQQVSAEIRDRLVQHIKTYQPKLFGVRDFESLERMQQWGLQSQYSFDDAYECLVDLATQIPQEKNKIILGHLNFSSYTAKDIDQKINHVTNTFAHAKALFPEHQFTLLNAYNEKRLRVCDSLNSVARLENNFPYKSFSVVDLAHAAHTGRLDNPTLLAGQLGISCSYHVTLLLHLAGIPCWLIANNAYYDQKAAALNGYESFDDFLQQRQVPDYSNKIALRMSYLKQLAAYLQNNKESKTLIFPQPAKIKYVQPFVYKESAHDETPASMEEKIKTYIKFHKFKAIKMGLRILVNLVKP
jgi:polysaccharide pyruvyl transferase WcaK-like protein